MEPKKIRDSHVALAQLMDPTHANILGNVHGGWIMKLMDEAGALACMRHSQQRVVTVAVDQLMFRQPIRLGDLVTITAEVSFAGRTSMEAEVNVVAENPVTGECVHTNTAYLVYVALDADGKPTEVPCLIAETDEEKQRMVDGAERQEYRLNQNRKKRISDNSPKDDQE